MQVLSGVMLQLIAKEVVMALDMHDLSLDQKLLVLEKAREACEGTTSLQCCQG